MTAPLDGIRVVEIDNWMAAPSAAAILADLGADVLKIEPLGGDPMRKLGRPPKVGDDRAWLRDHDLQFDVDNRGKRSLAVALDTDGGREVVHRLVRGADVFLCNLLPARQERFGLSPEALFALRPGLVHATLTGYGTDGPEAWRPGYDVTAFFGRSGLMDAGREGADGVPPFPRPAQGDHTTGLALVVGILTALRTADRTGEGQVVETSLYEAAVWTQASDFGIAAVDHAPLRRRARHEMILATANRYPCADGKWLFIQMPEDSAFARLCEVLDVAELVDEPRFATRKARFDHMAELVALLDRAFAERTRDEWGEIFDANGFIWGPVLGIDEAVVDRQAEAIGLFPEITHPEHGPYRTVRIPLRMRGADIGPRGPGPRVGEHTREVLAAEGLSEAEIDALVADGVLGDGR